MNAARSGDLSPRTALVLCALAVAAGAALRAPGMATDFWLDEVWTWWKAQRLGGPLGVFTALHDSNNHHLNTLWVYALGQGAPVWLYRLPAWIAGTAGVALGARLAWRRGRLEAVLAAWLLAGSFALVHFSSEARGYAPVVACALAAQWALESALAHPRARTALLFGAAVVAGLLFQLVAVFSWAGAFVQSVWVLRHAPLRVRARRLIALHALPLLALAALYAVDLRAMRVGSGDPTDLARLCAEIVGDAFGLPVLPPLALPYGALALALVGGGLFLRARDGDDAWLGFAVTIVVAPVVVFGLLRPEVIAVRYFLIGIAFALLLCADLAAAGLRAGGARRALTAALLLAFALGNARLILDFARPSRRWPRARRARRSSSAAITTSATGSCSSSTRGVSPRRRRWSTCRTRAGRRKARSGSSDTRRVARARRRRACAWTATPTRSSPSTTTRRSRASTGRSTGARRRPRTRARTRACRTPTR